MIENLAIVTARDGAAVTLRAASATGCARCDAGEGCGGGVFARLIDRKLQGLELADELGDLQPGQLVVLGLDDHVFLRATLLTYGLPLGLFLAAAMLAGQLIGTEWGAIILGGAGFVVGLLVVPIVRRRYLDRHLHPRILRRANAREGGCQNV